MKVSDMQSIAPGNPFLGDLFHMGAMIGSNVVIMYERHTHEKQPFIIVVNTETGERKRVEF